MATLADHLRCKILRSTAIGHSLFRFIEEVRPAEVSKLDGVLSIKQDVLRLDISMNNRRVLRM